MHDFIPKEVVSNRWHLCKGMFVGLCEFAYK